MARINLLPWRAERRKLREREFYLLLVGAAVAGIFAFLVWMWLMDARIDNQSDRNTYLQTEIKALDKKIVEINELDKTRSRLLARKQIIEQLQANRSQMVHLFDELVKTIPDGVRLTSMKQTGDTLSLEGVAESNARVASYMRNIDASQWLGRSDLRKIENKAGQGADKRMPYVFSLDVKLRKPEDVQKEGTAEAGNATDAAGSQNPAPATGAAPAVSAAGVTPASPAAAVSGTVMPATLPAASAHLAPAKPPAHVPQAPAAQGKEGAKQ